MKLKLQVCSLKLAKEMAELGIGQDSLWWWVHPWQRYSFEVNKGKWILTQYPDTREKYPAYTVAELGEILPHTITIPSYPIYFLKYGKIQNGDYYVQYIQYSKPYSGLHHTHYPTEANARAHMLIWLRKEGVI